jgi:hypothetical protein
MAVGEPPGTAEVKLAGRTADLLRVGRCDWCSCHGTPGGMTSAAGGRRVMHKLLKVETLGIFVFVSYVSVFSYVIGSVLVAAIAR